MRILKTTGEVGASVEFIQRWTDPNQHFDRVAQGTDHLDFVGPGAEARLTHMWSPGVVIESMIGGIRAQTVALSILWDGGITLIRHRRRFPSRHQHIGLSIRRAALAVCFILPRYPAYEVVLTTTEADRAMSSIMSSIAPELSLSNWQSRTIAFRQDSFSGWSGCGRGICCGCSFHSRR